MTTIYRSSDSGAPALSGTVGSLVALLDACLVNGYGSKAAAGWSKAFTGTNGAAFRQGGSGFYWNIDDNGPGAGLAKEARARGYETMSAFGTGTGPFPTTTQLANGTFIRKSVAADATARTWLVAADSRTCYLFILTGDTAGVWHGFGFGDFYSYQLSDGYKCFIAGNSVENSGAGTSNTLGFLALTGSSSGTHVFAPRSYTQLGGAILVQKFGDGWINSLTVNAYAGFIPFPNPSTGGLYLAPIRLFDGNATSVANTFTTLRGELRGLFHQGHPPAAFADGDTFDGVGEFAGRSFLLLKSSIAASGSSQGIWCVETTAWNASP